MDKIQYDELRQLASRFLNVLEVLSRFANHEVPDDIAESLNVTHIRALYYVFTEPGISQKDIAEKLQLTAATVSTAIRYMEELDLIERRQDATDARIMCLFLGTRGQDLVKRVRDKQLIAAAEFIRFLDEDDRVLLINLLERGLARYAKHVASTNVDQAL